MLARIVTAYQRYESLTDTEKAAAFNVAIAAWADAVLSTPQSKPPAAAPAPNWSELVRDSLDLLHSFAPAVRAYAEARGGANLAELKQRLAELEQRFAQRPVPTAKAPEGVPPLNLTPEKNP